MVTVVGLSFDVKMFSDKLRLFVALTSLVFIINQNLSSAAENKSSSEKVDNKTGVYFILVTQHLRRMRYTRS